jgi:hypothetical protein
MNKKRNYYANNKEKIKEYKKEYNKNYYANNKEKVKEQQQKYRLNNYDKIEQYKMNYRMKDEQRYLMKKKEYHTNYYHKKERIEYFKLNVLYELLNGKKPKNYPLQYDNNSCNYFPPRCNKKYSIYYRIMHNIKAY